ncbi:Sister chromatid cohesion protein 2, partial [Blyttiomyces sp. JEL0837]
KPKRANHNELERKRRFNQRNALGDLRDVIPIITTDKPSTIHIMEKAREYIQSLQLQVSQLTQELSQLKKSGATSMSTSIISTGPTNNNDQASPSPPPSGPAPTTSSSTSTAGNTGKGKQKNSDATGTGAGTGRKGRGKAAKNDAVAVDDNVVKEKEGVKGRDGGVDEKVVSSVQGGVGVGSVVSPPQDQQTPIWGLYNTSGFLGKLGTKSKVEDTSFTNDLSDSNFIRKTSSPLLSPPINVDTASGNPTTTRTSPSSTTARNPITDISPTSATCNESSNQLLQIPQRYNNQIQNESTSTSPVLKSHPATSSSSSSTSPSPRVNSVIPSVANSGINMGSNQLVTPSPSQPTSPVVSNRNWNNKNSGQGVVSSVPSSVSGSGEISPTTAAITTSTSFTSPSSLHQHHEIVRLRGSARSKRALSTSVLQPGRGAQFLTEMVAGGGITTSKRSYGATGVVGRSVTSPLLQQQQQQQQHGSPVIQQQQQQQQQSFLGMDVGVVVPSSPGLFRFFNTHGTGATTGVDGVQQQQQQPHISGFDSLTSGPSGSLLHGSGGGRGRGESLGVNPSFEDHLSEEFGSPRSSHSVVVGVKPELYLSSGGGGVGHHQRSSSGVSLTGTTASSSGFNPAAMYSDDSFRPSPFGMDELDSHHSHSQYQHNRLHQASGFGGITTGDTAGLSSPVASIANLTHHHSHQSFPGITSQLNDLSSSGVLDHHHHHHHSNHHHHSRASSLAPSHISLPSLPVAVPILPSTSTSSTSSTTPTTPNAALPLGMSVTIADGIAVATEHGEEIFCGVCKNGFNGIVMLDCDRCHVWFHAPCVGLVVDCIPHSWSCGECCRLSLSEQQQQQQQQVMQGQGHREGGFTDVLGIGMLGVGEMGGLGMRGGGSGGGFGV